MEGYFCRRSGQVPSSPTLQPARNFSPSGSAGHAQSCRPLDMGVVALDTATEACSVALLTDAGLVGAWREVGRGHAEQILDMVDVVLSEAGTVLGMLDGIAASVGPGAFTGVRIGVSVAQGLAFGAALPVVAGTTPEAL